MTTEHLMRSGAPPQERAARIAAMFAGTAISLIDEGQIVEARISRRDDAEAWYWLTGSMFKAMRRRFAIENLLLSLRGCPEESDGHDAIILARLMDGSVMADRIARHNASLDGEDRAMLSPLWPRLGERIAVPDYDAAELHAIIVDAFAQQSFPTASDLYRQPVQQHDVKDEFL